MIKRTLGALAVLAFTTGCSSIATFHTADTTKAGEISNTFAFGTLTATVDTASGLKVEEDDINSEDISVPMFEYMLRYGINDSMDFGLRTTGTVHGADFKWKFLDSGKFKMATGLGFSYLNYELSSTLTKQEVTAIDLFVPLHMQYDISESFSFYLTPKYMNRSVSVDTTTIASSATTSDSDSVGFMGASVGVKWGKDKGVMLEYTMMTGEADDGNSATDDKVDLSQYGVGLFWN